MVVLIQKNVFLMALRMSSQLTGQVNVLKDLYQKLEAFQAEVAVSRSARHWFNLNCQTNITIVTPLSLADLLFWINWRPDQTKAILQLCANCTRADVALNNIVVRARTRTGSCGKFWEITSGTLLPCCLAKECQGSECQVDPEAESFFWQKADQKGFQGQSTWILPKCFLENQL